MENCLDSQHVWIGAALIQAVEVPLSPLLRGESLVHALNDSRSKVIVVAEEFHRHIEAVSERLEHLERVVIMQSSNSAAPESAFEIVSRDDLIQPVCCHDGLCSAATERHRLCCLYLRNYGPIERGAHNLGSIECNGCVNRCLLVRR